MRSKPPLRGVYAITPTGLNDQALYAAATAVLRGGVRWLQYRCKQAGDTTRQRQAAMLVALCKQYGAALIVNDNVKVAVAVAASGVHLGQQDMPIATARTLMPTTMLIGMTCHHQIPEPCNADYCAFGAVFNSPTKPAASPCPLTVVTAAAKRLACPIVAIGGITRDNARRVIDAGADAIAVSSGLFSVKAVEAEATALVSLFKV